MSVRVFAPAKINLTLEVGPAKANGRHPLQSVVTFADVGDWIEAAPADDVTLRVTGPSAGALSNEDDNLVLRAARALAAARGVRAGAALTLTKELPIASGIGGGSSDAAATLNALNALWGLGLSAEELTAIAAPLGGDVPVCVAARPAYMSGEGERVAPISLPSLDAVLVNPGFAIATAAVFAAFDAQALGGSFRDAPAPFWRTREDVCAEIAARGNDLWPAACALAPNLAEIAVTLSRAPEALHVSMSGSGATMFALTADSAASARLAERLAQANPTWWVRAVRLGALDAPATRR